MKPHVRFLINSFFIILFIVLVYWFVNPLFVYHFQQIGFFNDSYFLKSMLSLPGGLIEYSSVFLFQFTKYRFAGALLYAILTFLVVLFVKILLSSAKIKANIVVMYLPVLALSVLIGNYSFPVYYLLLAVVMVFLLVVYKAFSKLLKHYYEQFIPAIIIMPFAFYLLGGGVFLLFSVSLMFIEIFSSQRIKPISLFLIALLSVVVPLVSAHYVFFITVNDAFTYFGPSLSSYPFSFELLSFFAAVPLAILLQWIAIKIGRFIRIKPFYSYLQYSIVAIVFVLLFVSNFDQNQRFKTEIDYLAHNGKWEKILEKVDEKYSEDRMVIFFTNKALFYTGQLPNRLFDYPQTWGVDGLLLHRHYVREELFPTSVLYMEMGYLNEAIHWANEAISQHEYSPAIIKQLIVAHIIDENYSYAMLYVNMLKKFPFFKKEALHFEKMINTDSPDDWMLELRKMRPYTNFRVNPISLDNDFLFLLDDHPENRMLYEYLMAYYLLNNNFEGFRRHAGKGAVFKYGAIPKSFQQAMVHIIAKMRAAGHDLPLVGIDQEVLDYYTEYNNILGIFEGNTQEAKPVMDDYKHTYWYYLDYVSPVTLNLKITVE